MANKRITQLSAITQCNQTDVLLVGQTSADKKITVANLRLDLLQDRVAGGTNVIDITTNGATQTLTAKTLTSPKINSTTAVSATSQQINILDGATLDVNQLNILDGATISTAQLNRLSGATSAIQTQLNTKLTALSQSNYPVFTAVTFTASSTSKDISNSDVMTAIGISPLAWVVNANTLHVQTYQVTSGSLARTLVHPGIGYTVAVNGTNGYKLDQIKLTDITNEKVYDVHLTFKLLTYSSPT